MEYSNAIAFAPYAFLGLLISVVMDVYSSGASLAEFSAKKWATDNGVRVVLSMLCLIAGLLFSEDIFGVKLNALTAFWGGIGNDNLINMFVRRRASITKKTD